MNYFGVLMHFLRHRSQFIEDITKGVKLQKKIAAFLICSCIFFAIYGAIIGSFCGWQQILSSAIKLPTLYLLTLLICLPTLYFFDIIAGSKRTFGQYIALLLASMSVISVMLFGFAPVSLFFRISINDPQFFKLVNVLIFTITGSMGLSFFYRSIEATTPEDAGQTKLRKGILKGWLVLYALVGSQLSWTISPFFGDPNLPFQLFNQNEGNFYLAVWETLLQFLGVK